MEQEVFSNHDYSSLFGIKDSRDLEFAKEITLGLGKTCDDFFTAPIKHPFSSLILRGHDGLVKLFAIIDSSLVVASKLEALDAVSHVLRNVRASKNEIIILRAMLKKADDAEVIAVLAKCLALAYDEEFLQEQLQRLGDDDPAVVASSAWLLGLAAYEPAVEVLIALVSPERFFESKSVIWALGEIGSHKAINVLERAVVHYFRVSESLLALGKIGMAVSIPTILPILLNGLAEQKEAGSRALALILQANRRYETVIKLMRNELTAIIKGQLEQDGVLLSGTTKFYLLLSLSRLGEKLNKSRIRKYLNIRLSENELGALASFYTKN